LPLIENIIRRQTKTGETIEAWIYERAKLEEEAIKNINYVEQVNKEDDPEDKAIE
jgi:hypothetical protein